MLLFQIENFGNTHNLYIISIDILKNCILNPKTALNIYFVILLKNLNLITIQFYLFSKSRPKIYFIQSEGNSIFFSLMFKYNISRNSSDKGFIK